MVADLEAVAERVAQMQAAAGDLRAFQAALGLAQEGFEAVEDAGREASARWGDGACLPLPRLALAVLASVATAAAARLLWQVGAVEAGAEGAAVRGRARAAAAAGAA